MAAQLQLTPSQTVGPYFAIGLTWPDGPYAVPEGTSGAFWIRGRVVDGDGEAVPDAMVETWQAEGFGRCGTDAEGRFEIVTVKAPHIDVSVFARGLLQRAVTRIYFGDEEELNAADPILQSVPEHRRGRLIAQPVPDDGYRFDVVLQGADETVFFAV